MASLAAGRPDESRPSPAEPGCRAKQYMRSSSTRSDCRRTGSVYAVPRMGKQLSVCLRGGVRCLQSRGASPVTRLVVRGRVVVSLAGRRLLRSPDGNFAINSTWCMAQVCQLSSPRRRRSDCPRCRCAGFCARLGLAAVAQRDGRAKR